MTEQEAYQRYVMGVSVDRDVLEDDALRQEQMEALRQAMARHQAQRHVHIPPALNEAQLAERDLDAEFPEEHGEHVDIVFDEAEDIAQPVWNHINVDGSTTAASVSGTYTYTDGSLTREDVQNMINEALDRRAQLVDMGRVQRLIQQGGADMDASELLQSLNTDVVKIGNQVYKIEHVGQCDNLAQELEGFYTRAAELYRDEVIDEEREDIEEDSRRMGDHIQRQLSRRNSTQLTIPDRFKNEQGRISYFSVHNGNLFECRTVRYQPSTVDIDRETLRVMSERGELPDDIVERLHDEFVDVINDNRRLTIHFDTKMYSDMIVGRNALRSGGGLNCFKGANHHTMGSSRPSAMCTGNASTDVVWAMDDVTFSAFINHINSFSLGSSRVPMYNPDTKQDEAVYWSQLFDGTYGNIVDIQPTRRGQWTQTEQS